MEFVPDDRNTYESIWHVKNNSTVQHQKIKYHGFRHEFPPTYHHEQKNGPAKRNDDYNWYT